MVIPKLKQKKFVKQKNFKLNKYISEKNLRKYKYQLKKEQEAAEAREWQRYNDNLYISSQNQKINQLKADLDREKSRNRISGW